MKIYVDVTSDGRLKRKFAYRTQNGAYKCEPPPTAAGGNPQFFQSLDDTARWLDTHPGWGIWVAAPEDAQPSLYNRNIVIELS